MLNAIEELSALPNIEYAHPNYIIRAADTVFTPEYNMEKISAPDAWNEDIDCSGIVVGVLDTGIEYTHDYLANNIWVNTAELNGIPGFDDDGNGIADDINGWNFISGTDDIMDDDAHGHGTHVAGIIGAEMNLSNNTSGVAPNVKLAGIKVLGANSGGTLLTVLDGIEYAGESGFNIVNMSVEADVSADPPPILLEALSRASNCLFVIAAGNKNKDNDNTPQVFGSIILDNVIVVANSNQSDNKSGTSCWGSKTVRIAAPGANILSTVRGNTYNYLGGTSMSAPHVTGAAALILAKNPNLTPLQIKNRLIYGADEVSALKAYITDGRRLNVSKSLSLSEIANVGRFYTEIYQGQDKAVFIDFDIEKASNVVFGVLFYEGDRFVDWHLDSKQNYNSQIGFLVENRFTRISAFIWEDYQNLKPIDFKTIGVNP